ncbi:MAG: fibronectin type III domain-containing protein [bacterium]|nr:fibronectin type III domain-containing protein [bacterium]
MNMIGELTIRSLILIFSFSALGWFFAYPVFIYASEAASNNFSILESVIAPGEYSASASYILLDALDEFVIGTSTASSFQLNDGFLYYPFVSTPVLSATAGNGSVALSWTAAQGFLGWNVSGYNVGVSTVSGSQYAFTSVGDVLASTQATLTNGIIYYFIVRAEDFFGNSIATSTEVFATPSALGEVVQTHPGSGDGVLISLLPFFGTTNPAIPRIICSRSDLNCDGKTGLADFSILLAKPEQAARKILSYLFSDWTETLPIPKSNLEESSEFASNKNSQQVFSGNNEIAQFVNIFPPSQAISTVKNFLSTVKSFLENFWSLLKTVSYSLLQGAEESINNILKR